jgi:hypothetical protein
MTEQLRMTNYEAIQNLRRRDDYLKRRAVELEAEGRSNSGTLRDREAIALSIAALEFVIETLAFEAGQPPQEGQ